MFWVIEDGLEVLRARVKVGEGWYGDHEVEVRGVGRVRQAWSVVREIIGFTATIAGLVLAFWFYGVAGSVLEPFLNSHRLASLLGFILVFAAVVLAGSVTSRILNKFLKATGLSIPDRLLGAVFGLIRGGAICLALLTAFIAWSPHDEDAVAPAAVANSQIAPVLTEASRAAVSMAPMELRQSFQEGYALLDKAWKKVARGHNNN